MKYLQRFLSGFGFIALVALIAGLFVLDFSVDAKKSLPAYPNAQWRGGPDGGAYFEIIQDAAPYFQVQIRHENGELWTEGWFRLNAATKEEALASIISYDGGETVSLNLNAELTSQKPQMAEQEQAKR